MGKGELDRLLYGLKIYDKPKKLSQDFIIKGDSKTILSKCKEVLIVVLQQNVEQIQTVEEWRRVLPEWFVNKCAQEISMEEAEKRLLLPIEERYCISIEEGWALSSWIYWFKLSQRQWFWWNAEIKDDSTLIITVECNSWPFPWGALEWLLRASGALDIEEL